MDFSVFASLPASDVARARRWYADTLGVEPTEEGDFGLFYGMGGSGFFVYESQYAGTNQATAAGIAVKDFDAAMAELRTRGVEFAEYDFGNGMATVDGVMSDPDTGYRTAWFTDSEGNILALSDESAR